MLALIAMIPGVGPALAAALGVMKGAASGAASIIGPILKNPYVIGFLVALGLVIVVKVEEGGKAKLRDELATRDAKWSAAFDTERMAFHVVDSALKDQNARVLALGRASAAKLAASATLAQATQKGLQRGLEAQRAIQAANTGADACERAKAIDAAFLEHLP